MMGNQISQQMLVFGQSILLGAAAGVLYDLLRPFRVRRPRFTGLLDTIYCLSVGTAAFLFLLRRGQGELRGFMVLGAAGGAVVFFCTLSQPLRPVWNFWADTLGELVRLLSVPLRWMKKICTKFARHTKNLFYFERKCYTIRKNPSQRGGGRGEEGPHKKKRQNRAADQTGHSSASGSHGLAAVRPAGTAGTGPGRAGSVRLPGGGSAAEKRRAEADIAEGPTDEKLEEIARDELGLVKPGEYVFEPSG